MKSNLVPLNIKNKLSDKIINHTLLYLKAYFLQRQGMRESNSHQKFWRLLSYHLTNPLYCMKKALGSHQMLHMLCTFKTTYKKPFILCSFSLNRLGYALDRLVTVSSIHYCTSTSVLSTLSSSRGLTTYVGISHLEGGFTLRCLQRLSRPGLATLP